MKNRMIGLLIICLTLSATVLSACSASAGKTPTIIFETDNCTYDGPKTVPSTFTMTSAVKEYRENEWFIYVIVTLDEGKTIKDLEALPADAGQPAWTKLISRDLSDPDHQELIKEHNLSINALYHGEPIYVVCFNNGSNIGAAGPIQVKD